MSELIRDGPGLFPTVYTVANSQIVNLLRQVWMAGEARNQEGVTQSDIGLGAECFFTIYAATTVRKLSFLTAIFTAATVEREEQREGQRDEHRDKERQ